MPKTTTARLYGSIIEIFQYFNKSLFGQSLPDIVITFEFSNQTMAYFVPKSWKRSNIAVHEICINPELLYESRLEDFCATLVHEMVHLWQFCFGHYSGRYHNKEWAKKMEDLGLTPFSKDGKKTGFVVDHQITKSGAFSVAFQDLNIDLPVAYNLPSGSKNKRKKTKYTCICGNRVWGKRGLHIICGGCRMPFEM